MESILRTDPNVVVILAFTSVSLPRTSLAYTANSHLGLGMASKAGVVNGSQAVRNWMERYIHASLCSS